MNNSYSFSKSYKINQAKEVILVVDDDRNVRFVLKTLFQKHGYIVETSGNYSGLLRLIKELSPNLLITDVILPDGNENSPAYLVFQNYEKILKWNRSLRFGISVCTLANMINNEIK